jgi:N-acetylglucosamine-6-phosphate deacetylase
MRITGRIVTPKGVVEGGLSIEDGRVTAIRKGKAANQWVLPGFVDIHNHGGGGHTFTTGEAASAREAAKFHLGHGTTTLLASLVSSPFALMTEAVEAFEPLVDEGILAGIHFEGPYLSHARCGAQNPAYLRDPSLDEIGELVKSTAVKMMTIAPERPGALEAIKLLAENGAIAAIGHTDASFEQVQAGIAAGATVATHLFNGMRPLAHREPGPIVALLDSPQVTVELIADGVHLHDGTLAFAAHTAGIARAALITDAMSAAGMPDGSYELGGQEVIVSDRVARLANGSIAGSTLTMDAALRQAVGAGLSIVDASAMASTTPGRVLGLDKRLAPGCAADVVILDEHLRVREVLRAGSPT